MSNKLKVVHNFQNIQEGVDYELVLKDKNVLDDDNDLDELENVILKTVNKPKIIIDEEKKEILPEYSEKKEEGFIISNEKEIKEELNNIREKLKSLKDSKNKSVELNVLKTMASDYMTHEEFQKSQTGFKKFKKPNKINTIEKDDTEIITTKKIVITQSEDYELEKYLETQRNIINQERKKNQEDKFRKIVENKKKLVDEDKKDSITVSETVEFLKKIPTRQEVLEDIDIITSKTPVSLQDVKKGTASVVHIPLPSERLKYGINLLNKEENLLEKKREREDSMTNDGSRFEFDETENNELQEPPLGKGIAVALNVLRKRGMVGNEKYYGRNNDHQPQNAEIDLEYRDEKGRLMTQKEAYRYLCHIFHQNKPSKRKIEKKLFREQIEEKNKNQDISINTKTFKYLKSQQNKNNIPYVVLQGKNSINNI